MCQVNKCQESFHLILLEMNSFITSVLTDDAQSGQKSLAEDDTDLRRRSGIQGYPTPKAILFMAVLYCLPLNIKGTRKELGESWGKCEPEALDTRRHGLCLGPVAPSDWWSP